MRGASARKWHAALAPAAIAFAALALRIAWIAYARFTPTLSDDAGRYDLLGRSLAANGGFINPNGTTTMFWPPGYPFVLAAVYKLWPEGLFGGHEITAALVLNATLGVATVLLVYAIGRCVFGERVGLLAALITALFPSLIFFSGVTLTETTFTFLAMLATWLILQGGGRGRIPLVLLAGAVIGCATLVRGQALLIPLVALPFWWLSAGDWRRAFLRAALAGGLALLFATPWTWRNYDVSGSLVLISSNAGVDFYIGHSPGADGRGRIVDDLVFRYPDRPQAEAEAQINRDGFREGFRYALRHPVREVQLTARKMLWLYWRDDEALKWNEAHGERPFLSPASRLALATVSNVYYWSVIALSAVGVRRWFSVRDPARLLLLSLVAYWTLVHIAFFADPRFHAPIMPILALWAACGATRIAGSFRRLRDSHSPTAVAASA